MDNIIIKYLQNEATEEEKKQLLEWLQADNNHKKEFSELRNAWLAAGNSPLFTPGYKEKSFQRFLHNIEDYEILKKKKSRQTFLYRIAAIALLVIATSGISYYAGKHTVIPEEIIPIAMNHFIMGDDSKGPVTLPDGTVVWLHRNSKISFPEVFTGERRKVRLEGEGYFEVVKNDKMPFYVETGEMDIRVLGTCFNLKNYPQLETAEAVLLSGKVETNLPEGLQINMQPNQRIVWNKNNRTYSTDFVNSDDYILWIKDKLVFSNETLRSIFFKMERWYNIHIVYSPNIDLEQRLSFTIRRETKEEIFKLLHIIAPINYGIMDDQIRIYPKK